jgi:predicted ATPase
MHLSSLTVDASRFPDAARYPFNLPIFRIPQYLEFGTNITFFAGENGSGKSTLLRALTKRSGIYRWSESLWARSHFNPHEESLSEYLDVAWTGSPKPGAFFSSETYAHMAGLIELWAAGDPKLLDYFGGKSLVEQSHGESFMSFFKSRFTIEGVYFLDEPETALSPKRQIEFVEFLKEQDKSGLAQFIIATHSPLLLGCPNSTIYSFDHAEISKVAYEETGHFKVYRDFLLNRRSGAA